jgi:hypothetical protein
MTNKPDSLLWLDDHRGIYIPRDFAKSFADRDSVVSGVSAEDWAILESGPDNESYWECWADVERDAIVTIDGTQYRLHQDGALWLIPDGMEHNEESDSFEYPTEYAWSFGTSGQCELTLTPDDIDSIPQSGPADESIAELRKVPRIAAQLEKIDAATLASNLKDYGAWDETERADHDANLSRVLWLAGSGGRGGGGKESKE